MANKDIDLKILYNTIFSSVLKKLFNKDFMKKIALQSVKREDEKKFSSAFILLCFLSEYKVPKILRQVQSRMFRKSLKAAPEIDHKILPHKMSFLSTQ